MIVMKFGGTSLANASRIQRATQIVLSHMRAKPAVVVSAFSGVTDGLLSAANLSLNGKNAEGPLEGIIRRHYTTIGDLGLSPSIITDEVSQVKRVVEGISLLEELTPKTKDKLVSFGERMAARILAGSITASGLADALPCDAYDLGLLTDSNFGEADVLPESYGEIKRNLSGIKGVPVITGFIGKDRDGHVTTLGRGGSDYTASIVGAAVEAAEIQIWTDVNGIMTADPRVVKGAKNVPVVSYDEASELAFLGAKVLHPKTILPAVNKGIPVRILNTLDPGQGGTVVLKDIRTKRRVASIACKKKIQVVIISTPKMFQTHGFLRRVFEVFDARHASVDMISTSEVSISITLDKGQDTRLLMEDLRKLADVKLLSNRAKVSLVGKGMADIPGILGKLFTSLKGIEVEMVSSSRSEISQGFVVEERYADEAVGRLHASFFGG